jgi:hypothetical protein
VGVTAGIEASSRAARSGLRGTYSGTYSRRVGAAVPAGTGGPGFGLTVANKGDAVRRAALREDAGEEVTERWGVEVEGVRWVPRGVPWEGTGLPAAAAAESGGRRNGTRARGLMSALLEGDGATWEGPGAVSSGLVL